MKQWMPPGKRSSTQSETSPNEDKYVGLMDSAKLVLNYIIRTSGTYDTYDFILSMLSDDFCWSNVEETGGIHMPEPRRGVDPLRSRAFQGCAILMRIGSMVLGSQNLKRYMYIYIQIKTSHHLILWPNYPASVLTWLVALAVILYHYILLLCVYIYIHTQPFK